MAELFADFEINRAPRWPLLVRLLGGSIALHAILIACAIYVAPVRDALNIAGTLSRVRYVDEEYQKTQIGERAEIIEFPHERFTYPEGYFSKEVAQPTPEATIIAQASAPPP